MPTVDSYIAGFPEETQVLLEQMRATIKKAAPDAEESISYMMPGYKYCGKPLVYFGGFKKHIGFYATPQGHTAFEKELSEYVQGKGSVQFPIDEPLPLKLVAKIVAYKVKENKKLSLTKTDKKTKK